MRAARWVALAAALASLGCAARTAEIRVPSEDPGRRLTAYVITPEGTGPFPTAILLHGCSGLHVATTHQSTYRLLQEYASWYLERGYASAIVDSFTGRGAVETCSAYGMHPNPVARAWDAYRTLDELVRAGIADPGRAVVQGLSHGGTTVLQALDRSVAERSGVAHRFAAGIAYYPACGGAFRLSFYAPLLVLIGELDDWTPAVPCVQLEQHQKAQHGADVRLTVYPGAVHSFDFPSSGIRKNQYGKLVGHDPAATADAERRRDAFLREVVR